MLVSARGFKQKNVYVIEGLCLKGILKVTM